MGLFGTRKAGGGADVARMREHFAREYGGPPPSIGAAVDAAAAQLGVRRADVDEIVALTAAYNLFGGLADHYGAAANVRGIGAAVDGVIERTGFDDDAIWDAVLSYGPVGVAVALKMARDDIGGTIPTVVKDRLEEEGGVQPLAALPDPGLDPSAPAQIAYSAMSSLGMYSVVHGPGTPNQLVDMLYATVPAFRGSVAAEPFALIDDQRRWTAYWTPDSAAVVVFYLFDGGDDMTPMMEIIDQLAAVPAPWSVGLGKVDARVPQGAFDTIAHGQIVPPAALDALAAPDHAGERRRIRAEIEAAGLVAVGPVLYKGTMPGVEGRTQLLWAMIDDVLQLFSPILEGVVDDLPDWLAAHDFGRYRIEAMPPFGVLSLALPLSSSVDTIREEALVLCRYADECEQSLTPGSDEL